MGRCVAIGLCLLVLAGLGRVEADDQADELARLAGEYVAQSSVRLGQAPAADEVLKGLSLRVNQDDWVQKFRGDTAPYKIKLGLAANSKTMQLIHQRVPAVRNCTYVLQEDVLTVTELLGDDGDMTVTVWKRKPNK